MAKKKIKCTLRVVDLYYEEGNTPHYYGFKKGDKIAEKHRMKNGSAVIFDKDDYEPSKLIMQFENLDILCADPTYNIKDIVFNELNRKKMSNKLLKNLWKIFKKYEIETTVRESHNNIEYDWSVVNSRIKDRIQTAILDGDL